MVTENELSFIVKLFFENKNLNVQNISVYQNLNDGDNTYELNVVFGDIECKIVKNDVFTFLSNANEINTLNQIVNVANFYIANYDMSPDYYTQYTISKNKNGFDVYFAN